MENTRNPDQKIHNSRRSAMTGRYEDTFDTEQVGVESNPTTEDNFYAKPYNQDASGFFFSSEDEYEQRLSECLDAFGLLVEEFEIQFIDGSREESDLFR